MSTSNKLVYKIFYDKKGKLVLFQTPNWPLLGFMFWLVVALFSSGNLQIVATVLATALIVIWALLELISGVTLFRRLIGLSMLILVFLGLIVLVFI